MMTAEKPKKKRVWTPWYRLPLDLQAWCEQCRVPMDTTSSHVSDDGKSRVRTHRCPRCGDTDKRSIPLD